MSAAEGGGAASEPAVPVQPERMQPEPAQPDRARSGSWLQGITHRLGFDTRDGVRVAQVEAVATLLIVGLGLFMRCSGVLYGDVIGFWNDEANWAMRLARQPLKDLLIRPIGFMLVTRWVVSALGEWEFAYRLLPWLAGLATPFIGVLLGRRFLKRPAARLLLVGILSLSPVAVDFSKEFKPYGISLMLHLLLPLLALRWHRSRRMLDLVLAGSAAALAVFFTQDIIFLYPGLFLVLAIESLRSKSYRQLGVIAGFAVLSAGIVLGMYVLIWSRMPKNESEYWGNKYGVFYRPNDRGETQLGWYAGKYASLAAFPGERRRLFDPAVVSQERLAPLKVFDRRVWIALHFAGLAVMLLQRRYREALLFLSPALICGVFNFLGYWPYGPFRTNLFLLAGMSAVASLALDWSWRGARQRAWTLLVPVALLMFAPLAVSKNEWGFKKQLVQFSPMPEIIHRLLTLPETQNSKREPIYLDHNTYHVIRYYTNHHARSPEWKKALKAKFTYKYGRKDMRRLGPDQRGWLLFQKGDEPAKFRPRLVFELDGHKLYMVQGPARK